MSRAAPFGRGDLGYRSLGERDVLDVIDRVPALSTKAAYLKQFLRDKLTEHGEYIRAHGQDMPEILEWKWPQAEAKA